MDDTKASLWAKALGYANETFEEHKEQAFLAMDMVKRINSHWGFEEPEKLIDLWEKEKGKPVPQKEILLFGLGMIADGKFWEFWEEEMYKQAMSNGYAGYEWYITLIYLAGMESFDTMWFSPCDKFICRTIVPEQWQGDYDRYWRAEEEEDRTKERAESERITEGKFQEAALLKSVFHRRFKEMEPEGLKRILREMNYKILACGIYPADEPLRNRFLRHMAPWQRELIIKEWCRRFEDYRTKEVLEAMCRMVTAAGLMGSQ